MSYKSKQFLWLVFKLSIVIGCGYIILVTIGLDQRLEFFDFSAFLINSGLFSPKNIGFLFIFTFFNWLLEITKWQILVSKIQSISWFKAAEQSLASLTFSLITPNRIGEYGAKALYYPKNKRKEILILNFIGNFYQLLVTIVLGSIGLFCLRETLNPIIPKNILIIILSVLFLFTFLIMLTKQVSFLQKWKQKILDRLNFVKTRSNRQVMILSFLRYLVFLHQFYFLFLVFNVDISYYSAITGIFSMYLLSSIVPMLAIFDFVVKGGVAVVIFTYLGYVDTVVILSITTLMWILNFAIPAIIGSYFVLKFKPQIAS